MAALNPTGYVGNLTDVQMQAVSEFRVSLAPLEIDDFAVLRFLRARKFNVAAAVELYNKQLKIRAKYGLDTILQQPPTTALNLYQKLMPYAFHFFDKEGHPVYIQKTGSAHVDLIASFVTREQVLLTHGFDMETMCQKAREQTQKLNKQIESFVFVLDVQGISMKFMSFIKFLQAVTEMDQDVYPERLHRTYVINAPMIFPLFWKLIKPFLDPVVASKVVILSSDYKSTLLEAIDAEMLPQEYGGQCSCNNGKCIVMYDKEDARQAMIAYETDMHLQEIHVPSRQSHTHTLSVQASAEQPMRVGWYFRSLKHDIKFSVEFDAAGSDQKRVLEESKKADCCSQAVTGSVLLQESGTVRLIFDNSYSMLTSKTLKLAVSCQEDHAQTEQ